MLIAKLVFCCPSMTSYLPVVKQLNSIGSICLCCWLICSHWLTLLSSSLINSVDPSPPLSLFFVFCLFEAEFGCVTLAMLELAVQTRLASNSLCNQGWH